MIKFFLLLILINTLIVANDKNTFYLPELIKINSGFFIMGDNTGFSFEKPAHLVIIEKDFYISKYEITFEEYDYFCELTNKEKPSDNGWGRGNRPVINVSWNDAKSYTNWLSDLTGKKFRLLSESEWEYVARAGSKTKYSFGDEVNSLTSFAWYKNNSFDLGINSNYYGTNLVGSKLPNSFGVYDMHGNVWEWCEDWHIENYIKTPRDGSAYNNKTDFKVIRGGSWNFEAIHQRSSTRGRAKIDYKAHDLGFRVLKEI